MTPLPEIIDPHFIRRHGAFFRPNAQGYCTDIAGAGVYSAEEARRYLDVEGLTIHPVRQYEHEINLVLEGAARLSAALRARLASQEVGE